MLCISHHPGDWTQLRAQAAYGVAFSGITWTSTRNTLWTNIAEKVSDLLVLSKYTSNNGQSKELHLNWRGRKERDYNFRRCFKVLSEHFSPLSHKPHVLHLRPHQDLPAVIFLFYCLHCLFTAKAFGKQTIARTVPVNKSILYYHSITGCIFVMFWFVLWFVCLFVYLFIFVSL